MPPSCSSVGFPPSRSRHAALPPQVLLHWRLLIRCERSPPSLLLCTPQLSNINSLFSRNTTLYSVPPSVTWAPQFLWPHPSTGKHAHTHTHTHTHTHVPAKCPCSPKSSLGPRPATGCPVPARNARDGNDAAPKPQVTTNGLAAKPHRDAPVSPSLQRYLVNPSTHELLALGLPTSAPPPPPHNNPQTPPVSRTTDSSSAEQDRPGQPTVASKPDETALILSLEANAGFIEVDPSLSLSPSPPACPSPEHDTDVSPELLGIGASLREYVLPSSPSALLPATIHNR